MADAMETATNEGIPALPPLQRVAPVVHMPDEGDGQNRPSASDVSATGVSTTPPPPQRILVQAGSAVSSITNAATSSSGITASGNDANDTPRKCNVPKRKFPDFSRAYSDDHSHLSGDESGDWEVEEEKVATKIAEENAIEELAACTLSDPVEEVTEMDYLLENIEGEEGNADEEAEEGGGIFETVVNMKTYTIAALKEICKALALNSSGNKTAIFQRIRDSGNECIERINDESFHWRKKVGEVDQSLPRWVILNPDPAPTVEGIDMLRGAEAGFFGPTNQENAVGATKFQYCCREGDKIHPRHQTYLCPERAISHRLRGNSYHRRYETVVRRTFLTPRSHVSSSRSALSTQPMHELQQRVLVLVVPSTMTMNPLISLRSTR